jgi:hypothetical protein
MSLTNNIYLSLFPGSVLSGISVYFILSYLFVPNTITIPTAIIMSILVFGLARYHAINNSMQHADQNRFTNIVNQNGINSNTNLPLSVSNVVFIIIYLITLIVTGFFSNPYQDLFIPWNQFNPAQVILLTSSILLCFFLPGYAIIDLLDNKKHELKPLLKVLLAYTSSIAIIGFGGYISASIGFVPSEIKPVLLGVFAAVLGIYIVTKCTRGLQIRSINYFQKFKISIYRNSTEFLVFGTLFALVMLSTYSVYQGEIRGDQWFHHGRALSFLGGGYTAGVDDTLYPSFFHGVLASFFSLSGVPSVNAYVSINFLNIMPVFAFYYFFNKWIPSRNPNWKKAALLACTFFMLSSGFGWVNMITMSVSTNPVKSPLSSAELFRLVETRTLDIHRAGSFIITSSPQIGTSLTLIALPLGFILLGIVKEKLESRLKYIAIIGTLATVGVLSHDEFYFFIIVTCLSPLIFNLSERKNSLYLALLSSFFIVFLTDIISPEKYYTLAQDFPAPLVVLGALFVGFMWVLYASGIFHRISLAINLKSKVPNLSRFKIYLGVVIVGVFAYAYLFTFLVWGQLMGEDIYIQQDPHNLPWYLYPLKLGVTGLLGVSFILSYFFRKFEREIFIFGLIAVIALLLGPYYDEYRFSKYIMVGMGAFAALFISRIFISINRSRIKFLLAGLIIGAIVTTSSLSVLMFNGYVASALQRPDFKEFSILLRNKIFPSPQEINFLNYLHKNVKLTDHIVLPLEYGEPDSRLKLFKDQRLATKIQAFVGTSLISPQKILNNQFILNASTAEGLYSLLSSDNTQYIILPKKNIIDDEIQRPVRFALENFQRAYEDSNYILLTVPTIVPPITSVGGVALIYQPEGMLLSSLISGKKLLQLDDGSLKAINVSHSVNLDSKDNETITIFNDDKRSTMWSNILQENEVNYIETKFRPVEKNDSAIRSSGIIWQNHGNEYHISLNHNGLQLFQKSGNLNKEVLLSEDRHVKKERYTWYTLKVLTEGNHISIYLDDVPKLQVRTAPLHNANITKVGIRVDHETTEFQPIKIGQLPQTSDMLLRKEIYNHVYYPINELALSKTAYDTFSYGDRSAFSHKTAILTCDPDSNDTSFRNYLDFVNNGGKLVVIDTRNDFTGGFSKLLNVKAGNATKFDHIVDVNDERGAHDIAISGSATGIDLKSVNATAKSYYMNNGKEVAPFALERKFGSAGGEIIFVNSAGYFDAVFKSPEQFLGLDRIPAMLGLNLANYTREYLPSNAETGSRFVGDLRISGTTTITTHSLLLPNASNTYTVGDISISNGSKILNQDDKKNNFKDALIENVTLSGAYSAIVESTGVVSVPTWLSQYDYIGMSLPKTVNLTLKILDKSGKAEFMATTSNNTGKYTVPISIGNKEEIRFQNIGLQNSSVANQTLIMKRPEIKASGNITVNNLYVPIKEDEGREVKLRGLNTSLDHIDILFTNYKNASRMQYVTYLKWIQTERMPEDKQISVRIPGDISERAKREGVQVPWEEVMVSKNGIILVLSILAFTTAFLWRLRLNMK